jgi:hypothetical protein
VYNLLKDLGRPRYSDAVKLLCLDTAVSTLKAANETFNNLYIKRAQGREASAMQGTMRDVRPVVNKTFKTFTDALGTLCKASKLAGTSEQDAYMPIIVFINSLIDQYSLTIARRTVGTTTGKDKTPVGDAEKNAPDIPKAILPPRAMPDKPSALVTDHYPATRSNLERITEGNIRGAGNEYPIPKPGTDVDAPLGFIICLPAGHARIMPYIEQLSTALPAGLYVASRGRISEGGEFDLFSVHSRH